MAVLPVVAALVLWPEPGRAGGSGHAGYVVRLAVAGGRRSVVVQAGSLTVIDGDVRDVLVRKSGKEIVLRSSAGGIAVPGIRLRPRSVILSARGSMRLDGRDLIGEVEILNQPDGLTVINRLPLERYLIGLLGAEMGPDWPLEALRAQAVAARSFFLHRRLSRENQPFDLYTSTLDQVYLGIGRESTRTRRAVETTRGEVLTWGNLPAEALYHACCGGRTRSAEEVFGGRLPYLKAVSDPDCGACPRRNGHGVGLCQWGARGMAERGQDYRAILSRYYSGCKLRKLY